MAGDTAPPELMGAASAVVNGLMFLVGDILIALPGQILAREKSAGCSLRAGGLSEGQFVRTAARHQTP